MEEVNKYIYAIGKHETSLYRKINCGMIPGVGIHHMSSGTRCSKAPDEAK